jgi:A/G-specific adenine glycosylase
MAVLRASSDPVPAARLDAVWPDPVQRARALDGLVADGLVDPVAEGMYALPGVRG